MTKCWFTTIYKKSLFKILLLNRLCKQLVKYPERECLLTLNYKETEIFKLLCLFIVRALSFHLRFCITYFKVTYVCSWSVVRYSHLSLNFKNKSSLKDDVMRALIFLCLTIVHLWVFQYRFLTCSFNGRLL